MDLRTESIARFMESPIESRCEIRWTGDSNFVSVVGEVRVLPEELQNIRKRLVLYFKTL